MTGNIDHIVNTSTDPVVTFVIPTCTIARELENNESICSSKYSISDDLRSSPCKGSNMCPCIGYELPTLFVPSVPLAASFTTCHDPSQRCSPRSSLILHPRTHTSYRFLVVAHHTLPRTYHYSVNRIAPLSLSLLRTVNSTHQCHTYRTQITRSDRNPALTQCPSVSHQQYEV